MSNPPVTYGPHRQGNLHDPTMTSISVARVLPIALRMSVADQKRPPPFIFTRARRGLPDATVT